MDGYQAVYLLAERAPTVESRYREDRFMAGRGRPTLGALEVDRAAPRGESSSGPSGAAVMFSRRKEGGAPRAA
jgi:hypothetical protein